MPFVPVKSAEAQAKAMILTVREPRTDRPQGCGAMIKRLLMASFPRLVCNERPKVGVMKISA
jgi:hypothetical protein